MALSDKVTNTWEGKEKTGSRESGFSLLDILALGRGPRLAAEVDSDAHEEPALVEEVACDIHTEEEQDEDHDEDAHDSTGAQTWAGFFGKEEEEKFKSKRCHLHARL